MTDRLLSLNAEIVILVEWFACLGWREVVRCDEVVHGQQKSVKRHDSVIGSDDPVRVVLTMVDGEMRKRYANVFAKTAPIRWL